MYLPLIYNAFDTQTQNQDETQLKKNPTHNNHKILIKFLTGIGLAAWVLPPLALL